MKVPARISLIEAAFSFHIRHYMCASPSAKAGAKSNEITAVPKLLKILNLEGCVVTVDALNCQREIARQVIDQKGDYALALNSLPRRRPHRR